LEERANTAEGVEAEAIHLNEEEAEAAVLDTAAAEEVNVSEAENVKEAESVIEVEIETETAIEAEPERRNPVLFLTNEALKAEVLLLNVLRILLLSNSNVIIIWSHLFNAAMEYQSM